MESGVPVPKNLLAGLDGQNSGSESGGNEASKNLAVKSLEQSLSWIIDKADKQAKKAELPGIYDFPAQDLGELTAAWMKESLSDDLMKKSTGILLGTLGGGITILNGLAYLENRQKKLSNAGVQLNKDEEKGE